MAIPTDRIVSTSEVRTIGVALNSFPISELTEIQTKPYGRFLQEAVEPSKRADWGLEAVLRETFPVEAYDSRYRLEYVRYDLGKPRYSSLECRQLRLTYGMPFRVWMRLVGETTIEEEVYLGDIPIMIGGGEFIINGSGLKESGVNIGVITPDKLLELFIITPFKISSSGVPFFSVDKPLIISNNVVTDWFTLSPLTPNNFNNLPF